MPTVIGLFITEETLPEFADLEGFFHTVQLRRMDGKNFSEKIILGYLDLSKFAALNPGQMKDMQFADRQEKWGYTLANVGQMELQDLSQEDEVFRSVFEDSMHQKLTEMEKEEYKQPSSTPANRELNKVLNKAARKAAQLRSSNSPATCSPKAWIRQ